MEIGGIVTDANDKPLSDINVTLKQGDKTLKNTTTDKSGNYSFSGVKAGVYNIVADQDGTTKTILVTVADKDLTEQNIKMPANKNVNSIVEVADDVPDIVVGGVDNVAEEKPPASGQTITVTLKVTKEEDSGKQEAVDAVIPDTSADGVLYFDFSLTKTTKETGGTETTDEIPDTGSNVLEIVVPYDFTGKDSVTVYRHHETSASALTAVSSQPESPTDGTFWADRTGGKIHIYATKFSTYTIAYTVQSGGNGGSGGGSSIPTYPPVIEAGEHGDVTVSPKRPERGDKVTITPKPDAGYEVADVIVTDQNGKPVEVEQNGDGTWSFTQPSGKVTIEVTFRATDSIASCPRDNTCPMAKFTDVNMGAWYHDGVHYCLDNGLMVGTGVNTFSPDGTTYPRADCDNPVAAVGQSGRQLSYGV